MKTNHFCVRFMRKLVLLVLITGTGLFADKADPRIRAFEQGVTVVRFDKDATVQSSDNASLAERLAFYKIPGLSLTVIDGDRPAWNRSYGLRSSGGSDPVTEETIFQAGSVSKFVTAVVLLHYADREMFDLDVDVNKYLKSWKMPDTEFTADRKITLRHLLTHQSGLPSTNCDRDVSRPIPTLIQVLRAEAPAINKPARPFFKPGEKWSYSNIGYTVIQMVLEDTFGKSLDALAREAVFEPLGMESSTFNHPLPEKWRYREALPHATDGTVREPAQDSPARAQGGLMTTPNDLARLIIEVMNAWQGKSDRILSRSMARQMMTPHADVPKEALGIELKMGLGVFLLEKNGRISFLHPGHNYPGSVCMVAAFPESGQGVAMALNGNIADRLEVEIMATLAQLYDWPSGQYYKP